MKKTLLLTTFLGFTFLFANEAPKLPDLSSIKKPTGEQNNFITQQLRQAKEDLNNGKRPTSTAEAVELMSGSFDQKEAEKFNTDKIKNNEQFKQIMEQHESYKAQARVFKNPTLIRVKQILIKLTDLEKEAIDAEDLYLLQRYNTLQKCLLNTESNEEITDCKKEFELTAS